ncbi:MerR family DNA-binding protein [Pseudalkalibacillus hwajinpoensis]|uniref:MerR family DNA-binding protein n=1 Tax=Guptibacillus hwajinpoensis TaxID=208199 RepID=UPI00325AF316
MQLIFRGKNFGFQLNEIQERIQLFDQDPTGERQLKRTIEYGKQKVLEVDERIQELMMLKEEMNRYLEHFQEKLIELKGEVR